MKRIDLINESIPVTLTKLAVPIMGTSLIQMAYNMTDMIWIGRVSASAVAAVGAAGMFLWLANGLATIPRLGGQVKVAQALGSGEKEGAIEYAKTAFHIGFLLLTLCTLVYVIFAGPFIGFFRLNQESVFLDAKRYLIIVALGLVFSFLNQIYTGLFTAIGNSVATFRATTVGLVINIVLDPVLIFGFGPIPALGVAGAAIATVLAQMVVTLMFVRMAKRDTVLFSEIHVRTASSKENWGEIFEIGLPVAIQNMIFSSLSMVIARLIAQWGDDAIAVQKVGSQIESISWMIADGFATAVNTFTAQNYGARRPERIKKGYQTAISLIVIWGVITSFVLLVFPAPIFRIFIPDAQITEIGVSYLRILGLSQIFVCLEITTAGAFQGLGKPIPPTLCGIIGNTARIPMALFLGATALELNGVWWSISISSILKGIIVPVWFLFVLHHYLKEERELTMK